MQLENAPADLFELFANADNGVFLLFGALVALVVQIVKNNFVNKLKIDFCNKFDFVPLLPFILGLALAALNFFCFCGRSFTGFGSLVEIVVDGITIGAAAVVIYKFVSSLDKNSLKNLSKDGVFAILFNEIVLVTDIKRQLLDNEVPLSEILKKVKKVADEVKKIYVVCEDDENSDANAKADAYDEGNDDLQSDGDECGQSEAVGADEMRRTTLRDLLSQLVDGSELDEKVKYLHETFKNYFKG